MSIEHFNNLESLEISNSSEVELREVGHDEGEGHSYSMNDLYDQDNNKIGNIDLAFYPQNKEAVIIVTKIGDPWRGKGYGKSAYKKAIDLVKEKGLRLKSARLISEDAINVWKSLEKDGLVEKVGDTYYAKE